MQYAYEHSFKILYTQVKWWITFEDAQGMCVAGYGSKFSAPENIQLPGVADYLCGETVLLAHAHAYWLYQEDFKNQQKGKIFHFLKKVFEVVMQSFFPFFFKVKSA